MPHSRVTSCMAIRTSRSIGRNFCGQCADLPSDQSIWFGTKPRGKQLLTSLAVSVMSLLTGAEQFAKVLLHAARESVGDTSAVSASQNAPPVAVRSDWISSQQTFVVPIVSVSASVAHADRSRGGRVTSKLNVVRNAIEPETARLRVRGERTSRLVSLSTRRSPR